MEEEKKFLILQQNEIFEALTAALDFVKTSNKLNPISAKVQRVEELKKEYDTLRKDILRFNSKVSSSKEAVSTKLDTFNTLFDAIFAAYLDIKDAKATPKHPEPVNNAPVINIQPLKLIHFDGNIDKWQQFKSLFDSLIHENVAISPVQKLHHLRATVHGEAAKLIENIPIEENNYKLCYDILTERYSAPRRLMNYHLGQILNFNLRDAKNYSAFLSVHYNAVNGLKNLQVNDLADSLLFQVCYLNLTSQDKQAFDNSCGSQHIPSTEELFDFLRRRVRTTELQTDLQLHTSPRTATRKGNALITTQNFKDSTCHFCSGAHRLYTCPEFEHLPASERKTWIIKKRRCQRCLGNHLESRCQSKACCRTCTSPDHHSLLHEAFTDTNQMLQCTLTRTSEDAVLLGTIKLPLKDRNNQWVVVRGILDTASQVNLITSQCLQKLGLRFKPKPRAISGVSAHTSKTHGTVTCILDLGDQHVPITFTAIDKICSSQPNFLVPQRTTNNFKHLQLADDEFHLNNPIDVLLGADIVSQLISKEQPNFIPGNPAAMRTKHGYVLMGKVDPYFEFTSTSLQITNDELNNEIRKFWELEAVNVDKIESPEDVYCENLFLKTHSRDDSGRYQVRLPIKPNSAPLTSNRSRIYANYLFSEKRLATNPDKKKAYDEFLTNYLKADFMEVAKTAAQYLHSNHAVLKDSSSTSLRVVINGSTPDSRNTSLNAILYAGPKLQTNLPNVIDHFRSYEFAIVADISKMFNQIVIHPEDRIHQHIFWRPSPENSVLEYEIKRLSFGHVSSPWLALRVIKQLIKDEGARYPKAAFTLEHCTYVDDILAGANSIHEAKSLTYELIELLNKGGFKLKKWISNCSELLSGFSESDLETPRTFSDDSPYFKVLGVHWLPKNDVFSFNTVNFEGPITKRKIMSYIARLFDPCGWCAPVTLKAKTFIQKSWCLGISWDDEIPDPLASQWTEFVKDFSALQSIRIPRNVFLYNATYRLLGFCDGSSEAFGCCVYLQAISSCSSRCRLLRAKSKVCPLRTISIPRIELLAARLLTKLVTSILETQFSFTIADVFYFTDSEIVLHWIGTSPHALKTFVANRITEILEASSPSQWRHVNSEDNPSDPVSRGLQPSQLPECTLYWNGPAFLSRPVTEWPANPALSSDFILPEMKTQAHCLNVNVEDPFINLFSKYSSLSKLQNVIAYVKRFIYDCKNARQKRLGPLTVTERTEALLSCAYVTQRHYFNEEITLLQSRRKQLPVAFQRLSPFLEERTNLVRAGGRLRFSDLPYHSKHPILLPKSAHLSLLICHHFHRVSMHSGITMMTALIHKEWWIFSLRSLLRKVLFTCMRCYKLRSKPPQPFMADLPSVRITVSKAFTHVGTDFGGPFPIKETLRRNARISKAYLCIFVCFSTKAVHLEVVTSLSTAAFLACFDRFVARRSLPVCVYSDRGTNYQGARNQLKEIQIWLEEEKDELLSAMATRGVDWKYSPPNAPNFGGLWESVIKSSKSLLLRTLGNTALTFEELVTFCTKIEAILNSRPLTPLTSTPEDAYDILTPGHFLVGGPLLSLPEKVDLEDIPPTTRWIAVQQKTRFFWKRWTSEYLHTLTQRSKWTRSNPNYQKGDLVWISRLQCSPLAWPLGRIVETHPGKDGVVRVVTVKTAHGSYTRAASTLIPFPKVDA